jgi:hypothetical protein
MSTGTPAGFREVIMFVCALLGAVLVAIVLLMGAFESLASAWPRYLRRRSVRARPLLSPDAWCETYTTDSRVPPWLRWEIARCFAEVWRCDPSQVRPTDAISLDVQKDVFRFLDVDKVDPDLEIVEAVLLRSLLGGEVAQRLLQQQFTTIGEIMAGTASYVDEIEKKRKPKT